jgi:hypothetical protein
VSAFPTFARRLNDMYVFDFETKVWAEVQAKGELPSVRSCPAWAKDETHVYIQGGYDGVERKNDFFACDLSTYTWVKMPSRGTTPSPRYFHSCCLCKCVRWCTTVGIYFSCLLPVANPLLSFTVFLDGTKLFLYGGYSGSQRLGDMYAYDFETKNWSEIDSSNGDAPSGRSSLVAQVYDNHLYVFGGYSGVSVLNDFYKLRLHPIGVPPPALVSDFRRLINDKDMSDVIFIVEGKNVYAHRAILAVRSEYFRVLLFNGRMRESVQASVAGGMSTSPNAPIEIVDVSHAVFLKVLEFLYTDTVRDVSLELGIHLLIASEQFMLDRLKALCEDNIRKEINVDNVIGILGASHRHNALGLKEIALECILKNLSERTIQIGLGVRFSCI